MNEEQFIQAVKELSITLTKEQKSQLEKFYQLLITWNQKMNLTRITKKEDVYLKHFYDSLTLVKAIDLNQVETLCDVGSGAGFPGIVLKIVFPHLKVTLVDKLQKRVNYLNQIILDLKLENIVAIHQRAEEFKRESQTFDVVTARAVANLTTLATYCLPLVKTNGLMVAMKGHIEDELENAKESLTKNKGKIINIVSFNLPYEQSTRNLVVIKKQ